jgi:hypothetical protein
MARSTTKTFPQALAREILFLALIAVSGACATRPAARQSPSLARTASAASAHVDADAARLAADVQWLADDARGGRRAGTDQGKACAEWISARLQGLGLEPAGQDGYLQSLTVPLDPRDAGGSRLSWKPRDTDASPLPGWRTPDEIAPLFCSDGGKVEGRLEWCGYGIENDERGWNDFKGRDLTGCIALIVRGTPPDGTGAASNPGQETQIASKAGGWGGSGSIFTKVMTAKRHGAVGVVLLPAKAEEPLLRFDAGHAARAGIPAVALDAKSAEALLPGYRDGIDAKPAEPRAVGSGPTTLFADVVRESGTAYNALGRLPGRTHDRTVVVGAHYDHLGRGGEGSLAPDATGQIHHGADDNASGTATVLEIARLMKAGDPPPCDVVFALWSGEEEGLLGSEYWAQHPTVPFEKIVANLNLDMVGRAGNGKLQVLGAGTSPDFAGWMKAAGERSGLELIVSTEGGALGGSSDHQTFLKRKIPALHLFSGLHADYHKPTDTADKFEASGAAKVAGLGVGFVQRMASAGKLAFVEPKIDKQRQEQIKGGFRAWFGSIPSYSYDGKGVLIDGTSGGSPAERAGFLKGDVLLHVGDVKIDNIYDFTYALQLYKPGDVVVVKFLRDGKDQETRVTLSSRELQ